MDQIEELLADLEAQWGREPIKDVLGKLSLVDVNTQYDTERYNGRRTIVRRCDE